MNGRKVKYFGYEEIIDENGISNAKILGSDLYVWTNLSNNSVVKLVRKLLIKFDMNERDMYIFLRADYSELHDYIDVSNSASIDSEGEKIGKYVLSKMKITI